MPRKLRFAPPGYFLHITQRGNYRQRTFHSSRDHTTFLDLIATHAPARQVDILAYCIMSNHFHLVARGHQPDSISRFMQSLNGQYAQYLHGRLLRRGRLWQERFYSCLLDNSHLTAAVRYVELNPVRARICGHDPADYPWSSAAIHTGRTPPDLAPEWLDLGTFFEFWGSTAEWREMLAAGQSPEERAAIRHATQSERPLGSPEFIARLESEFKRKLHADPVGRPSARRKPPARQEDVGGAKVIASGA